MPNWAFNSMTFYANGTQEGRNALIDFHSKLRGLLDNRPKHPERFNNYVWEVDVEQVAFSESNGLFLWNGDINLHKRGYIAYLDDIQFSDDFCDTLLVQCEDAWAGNIAFWAVLINRLYGNLINFTYTVEECGMALYYSNDPAMTGYTIFDINCSDIQGLNNIPAMWDAQNSTSLFKFVNNNNYGVCRYRYTNAIPYGYSLRTEGYADQVKKELEQYYYGEETDMDLDDMITDMEDKDINAYKEEYQFSSIEDEIKSDIIISHPISSISKEEKYEALHADLDKYSKELGMDFHPYPEYKK